MDIQFSNERRRFFTLISAYQNQFNICMSYFLFHVLKLRKKGEAGLTMNREKNKRRFSTTVTGQGPCLTVQGLRREIGGLCSDIQPAPWEWIGSRVRTADQGEGQEKIK